MYSITLDGFQFLIVCAAGENGNERKRAAHSRMTVTASRRIAINLRKCAVASPSLERYRVTTVSRNRDEELHFVSMSRPPSRLFHASGCCKCPPLFSPLYRAFRFVSPANVGSSLTDRVNGVTLSSCSFLSNLSGYLLRAACNFLVYELIAGTYALSGINYLR